MQQYKDALKDIFENGEDVGDRTGVGTRRIEEYVMRFDLREGFPHLTLRKLGFKFIVKEMLWFLSGSTNVNDLGAKIWNEWALPEDVGGEDRYLSLHEREELFAKQAGHVIPKHLSEESKLVLLERARVPYRGGSPTIKAGEIGPMYGQNYRNWVGRNGKSVDQIKYVIDTLKTNPTSRRILLTNWDPSVLPDETISPTDNVAIGNAALGACHTFIRFSVTSPGQPTARLNCTLYARSQDSLVGTPANISEYALLTHLIAREVGIEVGEYRHIAGDFHIYNFPTHHECYHLLQSREPKPLPTLVIDSDKSMFELTADDIRLEGYDPHPAFEKKLEIAV